MSRKAYFFVLGIAVVGTAWISSYLSSSRDPPTVASRTIEACLPVPKEVEAILVRSCKDCHSFETRWPWYSRLPVVSGTLRRDVERARSHMNLSDWRAQIDLGQDEERGTLNGICEELRSDNMPVRSYRFMHPSSRLSQADTEIVCNWTDRTVAQRTHFPGGVDGR